MNIDKNAAYVKCERWVKPKKLPEENYIKAEVKSLI